MVYWPDPSMGSGIQEHECLEVEKKVVMGDANPEPEQLQDYPKLTEVN